MLDYNQAKEITEKLLSIYNIEEVIAFCGEEEDELLRYLIANEIIVVPEEFIPV